MPVGEEIDICKSYVGTPVTDKIIIPLLYPRSSSYVSQTIYGNENLLAKVQASKNKRRQEPCLLGTVKV